MESKIDATDRLRYEGRWEEASRRRDEKRKQLRAEGKTRREANEESWQWMIREYPPLLRVQIRWQTAVSLMAEAEAIRQFAANGNREAFPGMSEIWWVVCHLFACKAALEKGESDEMSDLLVGMQRDAPSRRAARLAMLAVNDPSGFLDELTATVQAAIDKLQQADADSVLHSGSPRSAEPFA